MDWGKVFNIGVYCSLLMAAVYILVIGPIKDIVKRETIFTQSIVNIKELEKPIEWPALHICKMPRDKNTTKFQDFIGKAMSQNFSSQEEYEKLSQEVFHTNVTEYIHAVTIADSYMKGVQRAKGMFINHVVKNLDL